MRRGDDMACVVAGEDLPDADKQTLWMPEDWSFEEECR
jgi:hypothetical protein